MQTEICKLCFNEISGKSLNFALKTHYSLCFKCFEKLVPTFKSFKIGDIKALAIYEYNEDLKSLIYQFKGCYDFELKNIFLERYKNELKIRYWNYILLPVPSYQDDDRARGFNHVLESFKILGLKMDQRIIKTKRIKQSDRTAKERENIGDYLSLSDKSSLYGQKVLLVDDIYTTGSTINACIKLIKPLKPKKIEVLVLCKTKALDHMGKTNNNKLY